MIAPPSSILRGFLASEAGGGALLIVASVVAIRIVNAVPGGADWYHHLLHAPVGPALTPQLEPMTAHLWINDGLMALFFLVVGLEIKREWVDGRLASWDRRRLPFIAAMAGMALPALLYLLVAGSDPVLKVGWAIPAVTDIAFAIGMLALLGPRASIALKPLLTTVAIVDDMRAIAIIAVAYTASLNLIALGAAAVVLAAMFGMNRAGAFPAHPALIEQAKIGVLAGSILSAVTGLLQLRFAPLDSRRDDGDMAR